MGELRDEIYWDLCCIGLLFACIFFNYVLDLDLFWMAINFIVCSWLCYLAKEHFHQSTRTGRATRTDASV
jgi:hypothetical protein